MAVELLLGVPQRFVLSPTAGNVTTVTLPTGTTSLLVNSDSTVFLDYSSAEDGAAGDTNKQFPLPPPPSGGGWRWNAIDVSSPEIIRLVGSSSQPVWIWAVGASLEEQASALEEEAIEAYLQDLLRWLPPDFESMIEVLGGPARAMARVRGSAEALRLLTRVETGEGIWLTLHARGLGVNRATDEADAVLRRRIRQVADAVTKPAILDAVNDALSAVTGETATLTQWYEGPSLALDGTDVDPVLGGGGAPFHLDNIDQAVLAGGPSTFYITAPRLSGAFTEAIYFTIIAIVEKKKKAGARWALVIPPA